MKAIKNISWLAGILEGEGSFSCDDNGTNAVIKVGMTDKDVIEKVAMVVNYNGKICEQAREGFKIMYIVQLYGNEAIQWMMTIYSLMGIRRKEKIKSILILWREYERKYRTVCLRGHEVVGDNAYLAPGDTNNFKCKECLSIASKKAYAKHISTEGKQKSIEKMLAKLHNISINEARKLIENDKNNVH
jgi:hypothetical protein